MKILIEGINPQFEQQIIINKWNQQIQNWCSTLQYSTNSKSCKNKCWETSKKGGNKMIIVKSLKHIDDSVKRKIGVANIVWNTRIVGNKLITKINIHEIMWWFMEVMKKYAFNKLM